MKTYKILCFFGTRPEAIKMAPVVQQLKKNPRFRVVVAVSAQHRGMLDQVLRLFKIRSNVDLDLMQEGQSLTDITVRVLRRFEPVLDRIKPDLVLVHGDTTTTLGGSLAAYYKKIPVGHVEAGLRTRDLYRPFPEEMNRRVADTLTTLYFAPTKGSRRHLLSENHSAHHLFVTGNTVIDALFEVKRQLKKPKDPQLKRVFKKIKKTDKVVLMTAHRRENFGVPFKRICQSIKTLSQKFPAVHWIYPVHPNPNVKGPARTILSRCPNVHLINPLDYLDLVYVMNRSRFLVSDSGGLQEEGPSLGKPVLVFRDVTERPEAVKAGTVRLVGSDPKKIISEASRLLTNRVAYRSMANAVNPYGDGKAAQRIRHAIEWYFGLKKKKPSSFRGRF